MVRIRSDNVLTFTWTKGSYSLVKTGRIIDSSPETNKYIDQIIQVSTLPKTFFKNKKGVKLRMTILLVVSIILLILSILSMSLLALRLIYLYPALGLGYSTWPLFMDIGIHLGVMALAAIGLTVASSYLEESNSAQWIKKASPGVLRDHFNKYFSENQKNFIEVLGPKSITVEYHFEVKETRDEEIQFTGEGNKTNVKVDSWLEGKVEFVYQGLSEPDSNPFRVQENKEIEIEKKETEKKKKSKEKVPSFLNNGRAIPLAQGVDFNPQIGAPQSYLPPIDQKNLNGKQGNRFDYPKAKQ